MLSDHFNLTHTPFTDDNDLTGLFSCPEFEDAYDELLLGVLDGRRLQLVVGPTGSGRSTILDRVNTGLQPTEFDIISIAYAGLTLDDFLSRLSAEVAALTPHINPPWPEDEFGDEGDAAGRLQYALGEHQNSGRPIVILIDDAQHLGAPLLNPLPELLCDSDNESLAQVVMSVSPEFVQRLTGIELDQLNASIDGILHLSPWDSTTVTDYVCACIQACAGVAGQIFTEEALTQIYQQSGGVPARINRICIAAMSLAHEQGKRRVEPTHVLAVGREIVGLDADDEDAWDDALEHSELPAFSVDEELAGSARRRGDKLPLMTRIVARIKAAPTAVLGALSAADRKLPSFTPIRGPSRTVLAGASVLVVALVAGFMFLLNPLGSPANSSASSSTSALIEGSSNSRSTSGVPRSARVLGGAMTRESRNVRTQRPDAQIEQLTSAVESMRRTLISVEARMRSFDADVGRLKQTVQTLERAPRVLEASTVTPADESAPSFDSAKVVMASTRAPQALPAPRIATKTPAAAPPAKVVATTPPKALTRVQGARVETNAATQKKSTIVVRKGDTLWGLANTHNTTVAGIAKLNGLRPSATLRQGQRLTIVTKPNADNRWYVVRKGDSLYSIAKQFAVAPANLATWNCLEKRQQIFPGQRISVSRPSPARCEAGRG